MRKEEEGPKGAHEDSSQQERDQEEGSYEDSETTTEVTGEDAEMQMELLAHHYTNEALKGLASRACSLQPNYTRKDTS